MALCMFETVKGLLWLVYLKQAEREAGWQGVGGLQYAIAAQLDRWFARRVRQVKRGKSTQTSYMLLVLLCLEGSGSLWRERWGIYGLVWEKQSLSHARTTSLMTGQ